MNYAAFLDSEIFIVILISAVVFNLYLFFRKKITRPALLFLSAVLLYVFLMLFYNDVEFSHRYLLPIFIPGVFLILLAVEQLKNRKLRKITYIFLIAYALFSLVCGIVSYNYTFPRIKDGYTEVERIKTLEGFLDTNNIKCVYALDWIISQHINYFMPDISVRHQEIDNRRPQDSVRVDTYQKSNGCALVGLWYQMPLFTGLYRLDDIFVINNRYIVHLRPQRDDLLRLNFKLTN